MRILILGAFSDELSQIKTLFPNLAPTQIGQHLCQTSEWQGHEVILSLVGIGVVASAITTTLLCAALKPDCIIFCGVAGGLQPNQQIGDLLIANTIIDSDLMSLPQIIQDTPYKNALIDPHTQQPISWKYHLHPAIQDLVSACSGERLTKGTIVVSNIFPAPKSLFADIKNLGAAAIEMESSGLFKAAEYYEIPVICLRAISNLLDEDGNDLGSNNSALTLCSQQLAVGLTYILQQIHQLKPYVSAQQQQRIQQIVATYDLAPHPEGGWYKRTFRSSDRVKAEGETLKRYAGETRVAGSAILFLLPQDDFSAWHSVQSDETWCFHDGDPLILRFIDPKTGVLNAVTLGRSTGIFQYTIQANHAFCAQTTGRYSFFSAVVTPGFEFTDFNLYTREAFLQQFPQHAAWTHLLREI